MPAYVIADIQVTDPEAFEEYKQRSPPTIAQYGGKYLARGGKTETLEGEWETGRLVILEFESAERAREWWTCSEYEAAKAVRRKAATAKFIVVEGL